MANVRVEAAAVTVQTTAAGTSPSLAEVSPQNPMALMASEGRKVVFVVRVSAGTWRTNQRGSRP